MAETEGLHFQLTADAGSFSKAVTDAKNKLAELAAQTKILKQGEADIKRELATAEKQYGSTSKEVQKLTAHLAENASEQEKVRQEVQQLTNKLKNGAAQFKKYSDASGQAFDKTADKGQKATDILKNGFTLIKGLVVGYAGKNLYDALIGTNAEFEQSMTSFEVLLGSAEKADEMMRSLEQLGASTPFELSDLTEATTQLLAFGTAEADVETKLRQLGDLSIGNAENLDRLTNAYGRMLAKGKVSLEELNMFAEAGVPILQELQKQYNVTQDEMFSMISNGQVGIEQINAAMESMTGAGGQFFGMMEKQSQTMEGMFSTLADEAHIFARSVGEESFEILKSELSDLLATINEMRESGQLDAIAEDLGEAIAVIVGFITNLLSVLYNTRDVIMVGAGALVIYKTAIQSVAACNTILSWGKALYTTIGSITTANKLGVTYSTLYKAAKLGDAAAIEACGAAGIKEIAVKGGQTVATKAATGATISLNAAMMANPAVLITAGIMALVTAIAALGKNMIDATEEADEFTNQIVETHSALEESKKAYEDFKTSTLEQRDATVAQMEAAQDLIPELEALTSKTELTEEEQTRLNRIIDQINRAFPDLGLEIDSVTGKLNIQISTLKAAVEAWIGYTKAQAASNVLTKAEERLFAAEAEINRRQETREIVSKTRTVTISDPLGKLSIFTPQKTIDFTTSDSFDINGMMAAQAEVAAARADVEMYQAQFEKYMESEDILRSLGFLNNDTAPSSGKTGSGSSSGSSNAERDAREAEQQRKEAVEDYIDSIKALEEADADWNDNQEHYGKLTLNDQLYNLNEREKRYRNYCDLITNLFNKSEEELQQLREQGLLSEQDVLAISIMTEEERIKYSREFAKQADKTAREAYDIRCKMFDQSLSDYQDYISNCNKYGWDASDNEIAAIGRVMDFLDQGLQDGLLTAEEYYEKLGDLSAQLYEATSKKIEEEKKTLKQRYQDELEWNKQCVNERLEAAQKERDKELEYLDELVKKRKEAREDEDYALRMERLQSKLAYEMDEDNRRALEKEIAALQKEMDDTEFERDIENRRAELEKDNERQERWAENQVESLTKEFEEKMTDANLTNKVLQTIDMEEFALTGAEMGEAMAGSMLEALRPVAAAIDELVRKAAGLKGATVTQNITTDNSTNVSVTTTGDVNSDQVMRDVNTELYLEGIK